MVEQIIDVNIEKYETKDTSLGDSFSHQFPFRKRVSSFYTLYSCGKVAPQELLVSLRL